eukprot:TRINITY_DN28328_c0_g1_i2.p1 TRINITY_DN28328_c0_g1~~TRINITY_DN28328_c0_g1_i2.p1  ORF type:complete len:502 (-),score=116.15 TRINITY_DN28328_c0_g1_i2:99-1604(-)
MRSLSKCNKPFLCSIHKSQPLISLYCRSALFRARPINKIKRSSPLLCQSDPSESSTTDQPIAELPTAAVDNSEPTAEIKDSAKEGNEAESQTIVQQISQENDIQNVESGTGKEVFAGLENENSNEENQIKDSMIENSNQDDKTKSSVEQEKEKGKGKGKQQQRAGGKEKQQDKQKQKQQDKQKQKQLRGKKWAEKQGVASKAQEKTETDEEEDGDIEWFTGREGIGQLWAGNNEDLFQEDDDEEEDEDEDEDDDEDEDEVEQEVKGKGKVQTKDKDAAKGTVASTSREKVKKKKKVGIREIKLVEESAAKKKEDRFKSEDDFFAEEEENIVDLESVEKEENFSQVKELDLKAGGIEIVTDEEDEVWDRIIAKEEEEVDPDAEPSVQKMEEPKPKKIREVDPARSLVLTQLQKDVLLAMILGGRHRMETKNKHRSYRFVFAFPYNEERRYATQIYRILQDWCYPPVRFGSKRKMIGFVTKQSEAFRFYYQQFYDQNKNIYSS